MISCLECGMETKNKKFCSLSCSVKTQRRNEPRIEISKQCLHCGEIFLVGSRQARNRFCSQSCGAKASNLSRGKKLRNRSSHCLYCGKQIDRKGTKYCSHRCQHAWQGKAVLDEWLSSEEFITEKHSPPKTIRDFLIKEANCRCSICEWNEINPITERVPLQIDHIDGNPYNNHRNNLRVLCPNCHSLTPSFGALNKGNGRVGRKNIKDYL